MRIVQIIDSLEAGGAERMAVNYANALVKKIEFSGLIVTRKEGELKCQMVSNVSYLFVQKKRSIDFKAIFRIRGFIKRNKVDIIHAHSSSFFIAVLVKLTLPKIKIIWHDHYGSRAKESKVQNKILILTSTFFSSIFVVNFQLAAWNKKNMLCEKVLFVPNFVLDTDKQRQITTLKGAEGKRIVFLANLRKPKNHILVLKAFFDLELTELGWSMHLIGRDYFDPYSDELKVFIKKHSMQNNIHLYGQKSDVRNILSQASIGVLASTEEGFPVTLLEYASEKLAVLSTNVGYCSLLINNDVNGLLFDPMSNLEVKNQLTKLVSNQAFREKLGTNLKQSVLDDYSEHTVIEKLIVEYKNIIR